MGRRAWLVIAAIGCGPSGITSTTPDAAKQTIDAFVAVSLDAVPSRFDAEVPVPDGGVPDAGKPDAGPLDAAVPDAPPPDAGPPDAVVRVTVTGHTTYTYVLADAGETKAPLDYSDYAVSVLIPDGDGFQELAGAGAVNGSFSIPNVPLVPGREHYVHTGDLYLVTTATAVDYDLAVLGRPDATRVDPETSTFAIVLSGHEPAPVAGLFYAYVPNLDEYYEAQYTSAETSFTWLFYLIYLVDAARGDRVHLAQLARRSSSNNVPYLSLGRAHTPAPFTMTADQTVDLPGAALTAVPLSTTFDIDWRRAGFHALTASVHPDATLSGHQLLIGAAPSGDKVDYLSLAPLFFSGYGPMGGDVDFGLVEMGNPYPAAWQLRLWQLSDYSKSYTATGAATPVQFFARVESQEAVATALAGPVVVKLSPPRTPTIAGRSAFATQTGVGLLPLLAWTAPTTGTPTIYLVELFKLRNDAGTTVYDAEGRIFTKGLSVRLPPGSLTAGGEYFAMVTAIASPADYLHAPFKNRTPRASASLLTSKFSP